MKKNDKELPPVHSVGSDAPQSLDKNTGSGSSDASTAFQDDSSLSSKADNSDQATDKMKISSSSPQIADDIDLIEKEWVEKAKEIVEKTKENPYLQNKAISEIKADYIQKRYNKQVAQSEE